MSCACGSGKEFGECCEPLIKGDALPETAEALMRSRYTAYVRGAIDYILNTVHPDKRAGHDENSIRNWSQSSKWQGLEIMSTEEGGAEDDEGVVEFLARFRDKQGPRKHHEIARFKKHEGRWFFFDGAPPKVTTVVRDSPKVGRNDPCPCGSGRKYKKCCARAQ